MTHSRASIVALLALLLVAGCAPFSPLVAVRPVPYRNDSTFVLGSDVMVRPDLDDHAFPTDANVQDPAMHTSPDELARTPELVRQCLAARVASGSSRHRFVAANAISTSAFSFTLSLTMAEPGWMRGRETAVQAAGRAPGAVASANAGAVQPWAGAAGHASMFLEIRSGSNVVDRVHLHAQRQPQIGEPLEARTSALCASLLDHLDAYLDWRLAGN